MLYVVGMVSGPFSGSIGDRLSRIPVAAVMLTIGMIGIGGLLLASTTLSVFGWALIFALGMRGFSPVMQAFVLDLFPDENMAGDFGALKSIYTGFGALGPAFIGVIADASSYSVTFAGLMVSLLGSAAIALLLSRRG